MNNLELNIGLENNAMTVQDIVVRLYNVLGQDVIEGFRIEKGEWNGEPEKTLVIKGMTHFNLPVVVSELTLLTEDMKQDAISISSEQYDLLIYSRKFIGKTQKFNDEYFIRY